MKTRGFTLIEVMLSVTILAFVMAGISSVLIKQSQASVQQLQQRDMEESGRLALMELARAVRLGGYGINPLGAFDFDRYGCATPGTGTSCNNGKTRDAVDAPDELVVSWRDPTFSRSATGITGAGPWTVTVATALPAQPLLAGRIVQLLCAGAEPSVYLALSSDTAPSGTSMVLRQLGAADGYYTGYLSSGALNTTPANGCFATASVMMVERTRYYVAADTDGVPSLWRERGRQQGNELLFRGIEDLQLTYDIGQPPAGSAFAAGGATPATAPACASTLWTFGTCVTSNPPLETATAPDWRIDNYDSANRYTGHPVNIRNVNIFIVARATLRSSDGSGDGVPLLGNRPARAADNFHRTVLSITEQSENLLTRAHFLPPVFANSNVGGG